MTTPPDESRMDRVEAAAAKWRAQNVGAAVDNDAETDSLLALLRGGLVDPANLTNAEIEAICRTASADQRARVLFDEALDDTPLIERNSESSAATSEVTRLRMAHDSIESHSGVDYTTSIGPFRLRRYAMAAAALVVLGVSGFLLFNQPPSTPSLFADGWKPVPEERLAALPPTRGVPRGLDTAPNFELVPPAVLGDPRSDRYFDWRLKTVIVRVEGGHGSGALVGPRHILTNYHVVESAVQEAAVSGSTAKVHVILPEVEGESARRRITRKAGELAATVLRVAPERDLALVRLDQLPEGVTALPYFELAEEAPSHLKVVAIGSAGQGFAWGFKLGNTVRFRYPDDFTASLRMGDGAEAPVDRLQANILATECLIAPGYSGGPLCDEETGRLVGITFAAPAGSDAELAAMHIALEHISEFLASDLDTLSNAPFDVWTAGLPDTHRLGPVPEDIDGNGRADRIAMVMAEVSGDSLDSLARIEFIDTRERKAMPEDEATGVTPNDWMPAGVWGFATPGAFTYDACVVLRRDGVIAIGYANHRNVLDEIRIGNQTSEGKATLIWRRNAMGDWESMKPSSETSLLAVERLGKDRAARLMAVWEK